MVAPVAGAIIFTGGRVVAKQAFRAVSQFAKKYAGEIGLVGTGLAAIDFVSGDGKRETPPLNLEVSLPPINIEMPCLPELCQGISTTPLPPTVEALRPSQSESPSILPPSSDVLELTQIANQVGAEVAASVAADIQERERAAQEKFSVNADQAQGQFNAGPVANSVGDSITGPEAIQQLNKENFQATSDTIRQEEEMIKGLETTWVKFIDNVAEKNADSKNKLLKVSLAVARELFTHEKQNAIKTALINGKLAITKVMSAVPPPASFVLAGLTAAATAANVAAIMGIAHRGLDYVPREGTYLLDRGEAVLQPRANVELMDFLSREKRGQVGVGLNVNITNNAAVDVVTGDVTTDSEGNSSIDLIINTVKSATQSGELDDAFSTNFGLSRANGTVG